MKLIKKQSKNGFTMIEMVLSLTILVAVILLVQQGLITGSRTLDVTSVQTRLSGEVRLGMERMTRELRNARYSDVTVPQSNSLQFRTPSSISADGNITWSGWLQYNLGGVNGQQLLRQDANSGTSTVIANKVTTLQFLKNTNPTTLTINVTTQETTPAGRIIPATLSGTVEFRN